MIKKIVNYSLIILVVGGLIDFFAFQNGKPQDLLKPKTWKFQVPEDLEPFFETGEGLPKYEENINEEKEVIFHVRGLGQHKKSDLENVKGYIQDFYGYKCVIDESKNTFDELYYKDGESLDAEKCIGRLKVTGQKTIYVTSEPLYIGKKVLRGYTRIRGNTIVVKSQKRMKETVIHEIGHTLGLNHCDNKTCVMALHNDKEDSGDFCNKCKKQLKK